MTTVGDLIDSLGKFDRKARIVVTGCYGSVGYDLYDVSEVEEKHLGDYFHDEGEKIIKIETEICSG